jgi:aspartyl-tRNA(Asn)/glutamyl-tRNA(Gln) amidotransferase subunit A
VDVTLPTLSRAIAAYYVVATAEAAANLARYDGVRYGPRAAGRDYRETVMATRTAGFGLEVKRRILLGTYVLSAGYRDAYYLQAQRVRGLVAEDFARAFTACDAVALPTAPAAAFPLGERLADPLQMYLSDIFTVPASLAGLPALTLPTGLDRDGLPLSLQLIGPALAEETLFTLAGAVERARNFRARKEAV